MQQGYFMLHYMVVLKRKNMAPHNVQAWEI
jgi:hypothetical protein